MKQKILSLLEQDSRLTASKIAIMLDLEEAAVKAAIKELEEEQFTQQSKCFGSREDISGQPQQRFQIAH